MIKLIILDLDGVLVDAKNIHKIAFSKAVKKVTNLIISDELHLTHLDGKPTRQKLSFLKEMGLINESDFAAIYTEKQQISCEEFDKLQYDSDLFDTLSKLIDNGYTLVCCSNSIRKTVISALRNLGIIHLFRQVISNQDVDNPKPHPQMYLKAMSDIGVSPDETLILEDSPTGLVAAYNSYAHVMQIKSRDYVNYDDIIRCINSVYTNNMVNWEPQDINVVIPMAGRGQRFFDAGYTKPKPLIDVLGAPMIHQVVSSLGVLGKYHFIVQKEHIEKYNLDTILKMISPKCNIIPIDHITEGAAATCLLAKEFINNDEPLLVANSDQYIEWDNLSFFYKIQEQNLDGGVLTFKTDRSPKWSYAITNNDGYITDIIEKQVVSDHPTVGVYYWSKGKDMVESCEYMINNNIRSKGEFYLAPSIGILCKNFNKKFITYDVSKMVGMGTPEDLTYLLSNNLI